MSELRTILDLVAVIGSTIVLAIIVLLPIPQVTPLRVLFGAAFVCVIPGYALISAFYPERSRGVSRTERTDESTPKGESSEVGITPVERLLLAVGISIVVIPIVGYLFNFTPQGFRLEPVLLTLSAITVSAAVIAAVRRFRLLPQERFQPPRINSISTKTVSVLGRDRLTWTANALVVVSVLCFLMTAWYVVGVSSTGDQYSELSILSADGEEFAGNNTTSLLTSGSQQTVSVRITNREGRPINYTLIVVQQSVEIDDGEITVRSQEPLDQTAIPVQSNTTRIEKDTITPSSTEGNSRIVWLLYTDTVPPSPSTATAEYYAYIWVDTNTAS